MRVLSRFALRGLTLLISLTGSAQAASGGPFGLGVILGEPTGLTSQLHLGQGRSLNSSLSYSFDHWLMVTSDLIFKMPRFFQDLTKTSTRMVAYVGIGGALGFSSDSRGNDDLFLGARFPLGGEYVLSEAPVGLFFELVPGLQLAERTDLFLQGGVGVRYFF